MSQYILGIRPTLKGLMVDPCIPDTLDTFSCDRKYRGVLYHIQVDNSAKAEKGIRTFLVDGQEIEGNIIPIPADRKEVDVKVVLG